MKHLALWNECIIKLTPLVNETDPRAFTGETLLRRRLILPQINSLQLTRLFFRVSPFTREPCRYRLLAAQFAITKARAAALNLLTTITWGHHTKGGTR